MGKFYPDIIGRIGYNLQSLRKDIPDTMKGFSSMASAARKDGIVDKKTKEFVALAIGISSHCDGCIGFHTQALVKLGVTRQEFEEILGTVIYMGGGPSLMYAADALLAFEQFTELKKTPKEDVETDEV
jgi:AhpD family alkylhydroperoxidase